MSACDMQRCGTVTCFSFLYFPGFAEEKKENECKGKIKGKKRKRKEVQW